SLLYAEAGTSSFSADNRARRSLSAMRSRVADQVPASSSAAATAKAVSTAALAAMFLVLAVFRGSVAIGARFGVSVYQGNGGIHQQHGKSNAVRVTTPSADDKGKQADASAVNQPAAIRSRPGDRIRGNKEGAQHGAAAENMKAGRTVATRVEQIKACCQDAQRAEQGTRHVPADHAAPQQPQAANRNPVADPFPALAAEIAKQNIGAHFRNGLVLRQRGFHQIQRRGAGYGIHVYTGRQVAGQDRAELIQHAQPQA